MTEKAGARSEKKMCQGSGRTMRKPAQKEMKKIGQRIKQEQKRKSVGRSSLINFLKRKVLPMTSKKGRDWVKKKRISYKKRRAKEDKQKGNRQAKQQKKDERGQRNEKSKGVGKVRPIKGRIWKNSLKRSGNQEEEEEDSPEKLGNKEGKRRVKRLLKEV